MRTGVTLARIADEASVSMSTVSKVLNGRTGVAGDTRSRVEVLLQRHGYSRRGYADTTAPLIELVFHEIDTPWALEIIKGAEHVARTHGLGVAITQSGTRQHPAADWIEGALRRRPLGVVLIFSDLSTDHKHQLRTRNVPFVVLDPSGDPAPDVPSIGAANWAGGLQATRHLLELGHRDIAAVTGPDDMMCSRARIAGYRSALDAAKVPVREEYVVLGEFHHPDGVRAGHQLLSLENPPTAIFAGSDLQALGIYEAARSLGIRIPQDLSVIGFDDLPLAKWVSPALTTVRQPTVQMAEQATELVLRLRHGPPSGRVRIDLATELVVRSSTGAYAGPGRSTPLEPGASPAPPVPLSGAARSNPRAKGSRPARRGRQSPEQTTKA